VLRVRRSAQRQAYGRCSCAYSSARLLGNHEIVDESTSFLSSLNGRLLRPHVRVLCTLKMAPVFHQAKFEAKEGKEAVISDTDVDSMREGAVPRRDAKVQASSSALQPTFSVAPVHHLAPHDFQIGRATERHQLLAQSGRVTVSYSSKSP